jgi:transcriptional regulator with XRE-family HTH domain
LDKISKLEPARLAKPEGYSEIIRELLSRHNINVCELARRINMPQPTIHRLISGKTEDPRLSTLSLVADYFSITIDQLIGHAPLSNESGSKPLLSHSVPIISWQEAQNFKNIVPKLAAANWESWLSVDTNASPGSFGLKSKKSMEHRFPSGSALLVDPLITPDDGDLVIVSYPNTTEATIRVLVLDGPRQSLLSITDNSISDELTNDIIHLGVIIESRFSYK